MFYRIKDIDINIDKTWRDKIFLTFDIDWASDEVLNYAIDVVERFDVSATWFLTHETCVLDRLLANNKFEVGIHPNFNFLVNGDFRYGKNLDEIVDYYLQLVPDPISVRSHDLMHKTSLTKIFNSKGIKFECNLFFPFNAGTVVPHRSWEFPLIQVPSIWEDDVHCYYKWRWDTNQVATYSGIKVFNFHPIHIVLNTEKKERYLNEKGNQSNFKALLSNRNQDFGTENILTDLLNRFQTS
jgi:hypothetical protein